MTRFKASARVEAFFMSPAKDVLPLARFLPSPRSLAGEMQHPQTARRPPSGKGEGRPFLKQKIPCRQSDRG